jgi:hypothetical protein
MPLATPRRRRPHPRRGCPRALSPRRPSPGAGYSGSPGQGSSLRGRSLSSETYDAQTCAEARRMRNGQGRAGERRRRAPERLQLPTQGHTRRSRRPRTFGNVQLRGGVRRGRGTRDLMMREQCATYGIHYSLCARDTARVWTVFDCQCVLFWGVRTHNRTGAGGGASPRAHHTRVTDDSHTSAEIRAPQAW